MSGRSPTLLFDATDFSVVCVCLCGWRAVTNSLPEAEAAAAVHAALVHHGDHRLADMLRVRRLRRARLTAGSASG